MTCHIAPVRSRKDLEDFIRFPEKLYRDCPHYIPALRSDQRKTLTRSASLAHCTRKMWLVRDGAGEVLGRICAIVNPRYNELYGTRRARFGWFDTVNDPAVARLLLETAEAWAREQGMTEIHGPLAFNALGRQGLLVDGFEHTGAFNTLYNYPYYQELLEATGYVKELDWLDHRFPVPDSPPDKIGRVAARLQARYRLHEAPIDAFKKDKALVRRFLRLYSDSFTGVVQNFIPLSDAEIDEAAGAMLPWVSGRYSCILRDENGDFAAFAIGFPDLSPAFRQCRGRLFPFGWLQLFKALRKRPDTVDYILVGAAPKWQNSGISALLHAIVFDKIRRSGARLVRTNPQIETNPAIHVWRTYGARAGMRRRCYQKSL